MLESILLFSLVIKVIAIVTMLMTWGRRGSMNPKLYIATIILCGICFLIDMVAGDTFGMIIWGVNSVLWGLIYRRRFGRG